MTSEGDSVGRHGENLAKPSDAVSRLTEAVIFEREALGRQDDSP
jgi:hypothetical protein